MSGAGAPPNRDPLTRPALLGVEIAGTGSALPERVLTNADLEQMMDTSDEWIVKRTGIHERRVADVEGGETASALGTIAAQRAMDAAGVAGADVDMVLVATMTAEMPTPSAAALIASRIGASPCGALDINAACSGFVYGLNMAAALISSGVYRTIVVVGVDTLTKFMDYTTYGRGVSILFGDGGGAVVLRRSDDFTKGILGQAMHADGGQWADLYIPTVLERDMPEGVERDPRDANRVQMNGSAVFKFAVGRFPQLMEDTLEHAGLKPDEVDMYVCHQSNMRILRAARERLGLPEEKLYINIHRVGNTVAGSAPICFDELVRDGRVRPGNRVMFVGFGAGLTWASSLWQL